MGARLALALPSMQPSTVSTGRAHQALRPKKIGLVIGINHYDNAYWDRLQYAGRDARRFRKLLLAGGFDPRKTSLLVTPQQTRLLSIRRALARLKKFNKSALDTVVVYISAHGTLLDHAPQRQQVGRRFVITSDTTKNIPQTALSIRWLRQKLQTLPSRRKALILATCYAGHRASKSRPPPGAKGPVRLPVVHYSKSMLILNAASYQYAAFESDRLQSDVYTNFLIGCIRKLRRGGRQRRVTAIEAHMCAVSKTYTYVLRHRGVEQIPGLEADVTGLDAVYLSGRPSLAFSSARSPSPGGRLRSKGQTLVQVPHNITQKYRVSIYRGQTQTAQTSKALKRADQPIDYVMKLSPGHYRILLKPRTPRQKRRWLVLTLTAGERQMLRLPQQRASLGHSWAHPALALSGSLMHSAIAGGPLLPGGTLGLHFPYLGLTLGGWTNRVAFQHSAHQQLLLALQLYGGYPLVWGPLELFLGGYLQAGLLWQDIYHDLPVGGIFSYGLLLRPTFQLTRRWGLALQAQAGFVLGQQGGEARHLFVWSLSLGPSFRL